jgi:hypothetical protein
MKRFEDKFPREAKVLMELKGRLRIHFFSDGAICDHKPLNFIKNLSKRFCPICGQPKRG